MFPRSKLSAVLVTAVLGAAVVGGCSSSGEQAGADTGAVADLSTAQANIDKYSGKPEFEAPGEPFDARKEMAGKTIASIPVNSAIDFTQYYAKAAKRIADQVGFEFTTWQNQGNPTAWGQGMQSALSAKADVIELFAGIDPAQIAPQMVQAKQAGVPVVAADTYDLTQPPDESLAASIACPCSDAARLMADWVTVQTEGAAKVLVLTSSDVKASAASEAAMKDEFAKVCPDCEAEYKDIPSASWASKILPQVQSALVADPGIEYVLPVFDTMSIWAAQAITQAGRSGKVRIVTYNGTPSILKMMGEPNSPIEMNVGQSNDWMAHVALDQEMRVAAGLPTNPDATWPLYIWTQDNLADAGDPPSDSQGYGDAYKSGFSELWKLG